MEKYGKDDRQRLLQSMLNDIEAKKSLKQLEKNMNKQSERELALLNMKEFESEKQENSKKRRQLQNQHLNEYHVYLRKKEDERNLQLQEKRNSPAVASIITKGDDKLFEYRKRFIERNTREPQNLRNSCSKPNIYKSSIGANPIVVTSRSIMDNASEIVNSPYYKEYFKGTASSKVSRNSLLESVEKNIAFDNKMSMDNLGNSGKSNSVLPFYSKSPYKSKQITNNDILNDPILLEKFKKAQDNRLYRDILNEQKSNSLGRVHNNSNFKEKSFGANLGPSFLERNIILEPVPNFKFNKYMNRIRNDKGLDLELR